MYVCFVFFNLFVFIKNTKSHSKFALHNVLWPRLLKSDVDLSSHGLWIIDHDHKVSLIILFSHGRW